MQFLIYQEIYRYQEQNKIQKEEQEDELGQGWRTFVSDGSKVRLLTEKRKNVGYGCNAIDEGLELGEQNKDLCALRCPKFHRNLCEEQKKAFTSEIPSLPQIGYWV